MSYLVVYDGLCNLCVSFVRLLQQLDQSSNPSTQFIYVPMQTESELAHWQITAADCQAGMILVDRQNPANRWQGSDAAEKIISLFPGGEGLMGVYRALPGVKSTGDRLYALIRDHRYEWFGGRQDCYDCHEHCDRPRE